MALVFGGISALIAVSLAVANGVTFETSTGPHALINIARPTWVLLVGSAVGLVVTYLAIRVGLGLLRGSPVSRKSAEMALWVGIPASWWALWAVELLFTGGAKDVFVWFLLAPVWVLWDAALVGAALYMRSERMRAYFDMSGRSDGREERDGLSDGSGQGRSGFLPLAATGLVVLIAIGLVVVLPLLSKPNPNFVFSTDSEDFADREIAATAPDPSEDLSNSFEPLGGPDCHPVSPFQPWGSGPAELKATSSEIEVWGLLWETPPLTVGKEIKMVWRVTGTGEFDIEATQGGLQADQVFAPVRHQSSSFEHPGEEWGTFFVFPAPGCWEIEITRGTDTAHVWVQVGS